MNLLHGLLIFCLFGIALFSVTSSISSSASGDDISSVTLQNITVDINGEEWETFWNNFKSSVVWEDPNIADNITLTNLTQIRNRSYNDLQDKPTIPVLSLPWQDENIASVSWSKIINKPTIPVLTLPWKDENIESVSWSKITGKPEIPVLSIPWKDENIESVSWSKILNKPTIPVLSLPWQDANIASVSWNKITNKPTIPVLALPWKDENIESVSWSKIIGKPTIPVLSLPWKDENIEAVSWSKIINKPSIPVLAIPWKDENIESVSWHKITNKPEIPVLSLPWKDENIESVSWSKVTDKPEIPVLSLPWKDENIESISWSKITDKPEIPVLSIPWQDENIASVSWSKITGKPEIPVLALPWKDENIESVAWSKITDKPSLVNTITAGAGLTSNGTSGDVTISADTTYLQRRVSGTCSSGNAIRVINEDGTVTCESTGGTSLWTDAETYIYPNNYSSFVITDDGKVGIGTTNPAAQLEVAGDVKFGCPSGWVAVTDRTCIMQDEANSGTTATWFNASDYCYDNYKARLCSWSEWYNACINGLLTNGTDDPEWIADSAGAGKALAVGNGSCATNSAVATSTAYAFRCCK